MPKRNYDIRALEGGMTIIPVTMDHEIDYDGISGAGVPNPFRDDDTIQRWPLGTMLWEGGLRRWVYCLAGAVNLAPGKLVQSVVPTSGHENMATAVAAANATVLAVTPVTTNVAVNEYNGGVALVNDVDGEGQTRRIKSTPAITAAAEGNITLGDEDGIITALTANSQTTIVRNPFANVIIHPSLPTARVLGVPATPITLAKYGWLCVYGEIAVLTDGTITIGLAVMPSNAIDGAVELWALTDGTPPVAITPKIGMCTQVLSDTEYSVIWLEL